MTEECAVFAAVISSIPPSPLQRCCAVVVTSLSKTRLLLLVCFVNAVRKWLIGICGALYCACGTCLQCCLAACRGMCCSS